MIRIVMADDHAVVREGLKRIVASANDMEVVGEAVDGVEVMRRVRESDFDVLLLDLSMPGCSGMELIKLAHSEKPNLRILVLSMHQELQYAVCAMKSGASGYLAKECAPEHLVQALRKVGGGGAFIGTEVAEQLALGGHAPGTLLA
jgi:DNA-binding NarL/FixJ family response regulator